VLAVGFDSAESTLVRDLIHRGELPVLAGLLDRGTWARVDARADIGNGAVWPTFFTGTEPVEHGIYSGWVWEPRAMACTRPHEGFRKAPFWRSLSERGESVGLLDVPFAPFGGLARGFEVSEWGAHDEVIGRMAVSPRRAFEIVAAAGPHPFTGVYYGPGRLEDRMLRQRLSSASVAGARLRGELAARLISEAKPALTIVVFTEVHHITHHLWHTVAPEHPFYADRRFREAEGVEPGLVDVYREVDRQVGRLIEAAGRDTAVMVFSLHGMGPGPGVPTILEPLLAALGFSRPTHWQGLSWRERGAALFGAAKRRAPASLSTLYQKGLNYRALSRLAQPTMVAPHDWSRTRAFSLPTDLHGYIRLNLAGRDTKGVVPDRDYTAVCDEITDAMQALETPDGEPLVRNVLRTAEDGGAPPTRIPDLIVHWADAAFGRPARVRAGSVEVEAYPVRPDLTGQHTDHGFCVMDDRMLDGSGGELLAGKDLHRLLLSAIPGEVAARPRAGAHESGATTA
jgi:predicted AlkP superfamily phosphohydrolase/phosphomutase